MLDNEVKVLEKGKNKLTWLQTLLPLVSGIIIAFSFAYTELSFLTWFGLIPLFYALFEDELTPKKGFKITFIYSFAFYLGLLTWLFKLYPFDWLGFSNTESLLLITSGWIAFSLVESLGLSLVGVFTGIVKPKGINKLLFPTFLWLTIEWLQGLSDAGLTWGRLAISQYENLSLIQSANLFGSLTVSMIILLVNISLALALIDYQKNKEKFSLKLVYGTLALFIINLVYGTYTLNSKDDEGKEINVAIIQGNILSTEKWKNPAKVSLKSYIDESYKAVKAANDAKTPVDLVVWSESAVVTYLEALSFFPEIQEFIKKTNTHLITGIFDRKLVENNQYNVYNAMVALDNHNKILGTYYKRHLVPFGEYFPFKKFLFAILPSLAKINALSQDITPGDNSSVITTSWGKIGGLICFDSIFPELIREAVNDGAELMVLSTNDSWYKDSMAVYQHNGQAVFRSIENDRYMIRSANTGISSVVSHEGRTLQHLVPLIKGHIIQKVKFRNNKTLYSLVGDALAWFSLLFVILSFLLGRKKPFQNE